MVGSENEVGHATTLAIVVSAGVSAYLPRTLRGIASQVVAPDRLVIVDTSASGGQLGTGIPLPRAIEAAGLPTTTTLVVRAPKAPTFGHAVAAAVTQLECDEQWLWLLHDDSAPAPDALAELLRTADSGPSIGIIGAKQRDWDVPERLLEVGVRATRSARRVLDIDVGEIDQGQYDHRDDVLAVGTAGALIRRKLWDDLGGTDRALGPFGDGLDLSRRAWLAGYRVVIAPDAVVFHARASLQGLREGQSGRGEDGAVPDPRRSFGARRRAQLHNWITTTPTALVPLVGLAILGLAPLRALWRLATKDIALMVDEMRAAAEVIASPRAVWRARRQARTARSVSPRYLRPLHASGGEVRSARRDARRAQAAARRNVETPSELEIADRARLARRRRGGATFTLLTLLVLGVGSFGGVLSGGPLQGGALWPLAADLEGLWQAATSGWMAAGLGHAAPADPLLIVLSLLMVPLEV